MLLSETTGDETLRYYYDSTGKVASLVYKKGDEEERSYFYTRNVQGDITAIYRSKDSKLMGTYEYDLWGRLVNITPTDKDTDGITEKNPYRYRGYYYDNETGFYYLKARYYDPEIRRFISADSLSVLMVATIDVSCKNLFAYSENNPVTGKDSSGMVVETVFDVVTLGGSIVEASVNPSIGAVVNVVADAVDLVPFVTGVGEAVRGVRAASKVAEAVGDVNDVAKTAKRAGETAKKVTKGDIPSGYSIDAAGKVHRPNGQFASNAELGLPSTTKVSTGSHGNSLLDPRTNYGYALVDKNSNDILKFGETLYPETRYSKSYLEQNNAVMKVLESGSKEYIHHWQYDMNRYYQHMYDEFPPLLNSKGW